MLQRKVLVIYTGGTIGMMLNSESGALEPFDFEHLYNHLPVLQNLHCVIESYSFNPLIDSSNMNPRFWVKLAEVIEENYNDFDGFVVLHGTDTMAYSASMLGFMLENLAKPVVFTGSQLPLGMIRSDGRENFITSIEIATDYKDGRASIPEVCVCFENRVFRGNRTSKVNAENFDAFISGNYPPLAEAGIKIKYNSHIIREPGKEPLKVHKSLDQSVFILKLFPGISKAVMDAVFNIVGLKAVILETYGSGNAPTDSWFLESLARAVDKGLLIFNVTQCKEGTVELGKYQTSVDMGRLGIVGGKDITTEAALVKLMYLFGRYKDASVVAEMFGISLVGEISD